MTYLQLHLTGTKHAALHYAYALTFTFGNKRHIIFQRHVDIRIRKKKNNCAQYTVGMFSN